MILAARQGFGRKEKRLWHLWCLLLHYHDRRFWLVPWQDNFVTLRCLYVFWMLKANQQLSLYSILQFCFGCGFRGDMGFSNFFRSTSWQYDILPFMRFFTTAITNRKQCIRWWHRPLKNVVQGLTRLMTSIHRLVHIECCSGCGRLLFLLLIVSHSFLLHMSFWFCSCIWARKVAM